MGDKNRFKFKSKTNRFILFQFFRVLLIVSIILEFQTRRWDIILVNLLVLGITFLPFILEKTMAISLPLKFALPFLIGLVFAVFGPLFGAFWGHLIDY